MAREKIHYTQISVGALRKILEGAVDFHVFTDWVEDSGALYYKVYYPNGYGASIIKARLSVGGRSDCWELAVLKDKKLCYDTPITDDVCGALDDEQVCSYCQEIKNLKSVL